MRHLAFIMVLCCLAAPVALAGEALAPVPAEVHHCICQCYLRCEDFAACFRECGFEQCVRGANRTGCQGECKQVLQACSHPLSRCMELYTQCLEYCEAEAPCTKGAPAGPTPFPGRPTSP